MKVIIGGKEINLSKRDVRVAKRICSKLMHKAKRKGEEYNAPSFYFTLLVVMYVMSCDCIKTLAPDVLSKILNASYKTGQRIDGVIDDG